MAWRSLLVKEGHATTSNPALSLLARLPDEGLVMAVARLVHGCPGYEGLATREGWAAIQRIMTFEERMQHNSVFISGYARDVFQRWARQLEKRETARKR